MSWHNVALQLAGLIGAVVAVVHGVLVQRLIVTPFANSVPPGPPFSSVVRRLIPPLIHFSTFVWFAGGLALLLAIRLDASTRLWVCLLVGTTYLFGAGANFWATRGAHPGWMLLTLALVLIALGATAPSSQL